MRLLRNIKYALIRLFRLKKGAKQVSLGFVFGFFPSWFPTFGIGPILSIALTKYVKGSVVSAVVAAALGSFCWPLLFYLNYKVGYYITFSKQGTATAPEIDYDKVDYIEPIEQVNMLEDIGISFLAGSIVNSILFSLIGYFVFYYIFSRYRSVILGWFR
jgi:uncharacterized protein (DUF2062 family)